MKQQVNLYQHRLRPIRQPLALRRLLLSWTVLAGVLLLAAWLLQQHNQQRSTLLNQQQQQLDARLGQRDVVAEDLLDANSREYGSRSFHG